VHTTSVTIRKDGSGSVIWPGPLEPGVSVQVIPQLSGMVFKLSSTPAFR
jgi:hypothetical protein